LASFRNPAKGSLFRVGIATNDLFIQDQDYNKTLIPPEDRTIFFYSPSVRIATEIFIPPESGLQQKEFQRYSGIQQRVRFPDPGLQQIN